MKIGLITLHDYNYGSALQCFATQTYIDKNYGDCVLIKREVPANRVKSILKTLSGYAGLCICHPLQIQAIVEQIKAQRSGSLTITQNSLKEIKSFNYNHISTETVQYRQLKQLAKTDEFSFFFSGSDQVWNGARVDNYDMFFLRFAPQSKRVAWAPSFGSGYISSYNKKLYKKYISDFSFLSCREESGKQLIERFTSKKAALICDPVQLLTAEEWRTLYNKNALVFNNQPYILLFFIDEISDFAVERALQIQKKSGYPVYSFGYRYPKFEKIPDYKHIDGSPFDFLKMIDQAQLVLTDSFHASVFSLIFHTEFYTYTRKYSHSQNQSTRIESLLARAGVKGRFDAEEDAPPVNFNNADALFNKERMMADNYLETFLEKRSDKTLDFEMPVVYTKAK